MSKKLSGRITLITGAARGIGAAVAERFAFEGAHLILVSKSQSGLEVLDDKIKTIGGNATLVPIDLANGKNIDDMAAAISKRFGKIDILIGNAAILGQLSPMSHYTPEMWEEVFKVNLHANWRLIRDFELLLRESDAGRAVFVTSSIANIPRAYWGPYSSSKAALEKMGAEIKAGKKPYKLQLVGLELGGKPIEDYAPDFWLISPADGGDPVGFITSPWYHPEKKINIAMGYVPFDGTLNSNGFPKGKVGTKYKVHLPEKYSNTPGQPVDAVVVDIPFKESFNANTREVVKG